LSDNEKPLVILSGYFNPLHVGHLDMIEMAKELGETYVIVNNDIQQKNKKGKIIIPEDERLRIVLALKDVDHAAIGVDEDISVAKSIEAAAKQFPDRKIIFGNGGDRPDPESIPKQEVEICKEMNIETVYNLGDKITSSTEINQKLGLE